MNHTQSSKPKPSPCQPESFRATLQSRPHHERLGFLFARAGQKGPMFVENTDSDRKYMISERQMLVLLQFVAGHLLENPEPTQPIDLQSWLEGFLAQSQSGKMMGCSIPWDLRLLCRKTLEDQSDPQQSSHSLKRPHPLSECLDPLVSPDISSESSFHVGGTCMMDVAGGGDNAAASSPDLLRDLSEQQIKATYAVRDAVDHLRLQVLHEIKQSIRGKP